MLLSSAEMTNESTEQAINLREFVIHGVPLCGA